jgi:hypothetical protein
MMLQRLFRRKSVRRAPFVSRFALAAQVMEDRQLLSAGAVPYLVPTAAGVSFTPIMTTGDTVGSYTMAGTPDGLGAFDNGDGTFTLLMNHEFTTSEAVGFAHAHNASLLSDGDAATTPAGSFVDRLVIRKSDLAVLSGGDQIQQLLDGSTFEPITGSALNLSRLCSADLAAPSAFFNAATGNGATERIFLDGEEVNGGRAIAHVVTGPNNGMSYVLPLMGTASWENLLANPNTGDTTLVIGNSDQGGGSTFNRLVVYVGTKQASGNEIEKAGLTDGTTYQIKDNGDGTFSLVGSGLGTQFNRPEDGAWNPAHPNDYYFVTTASATTNSQLWRLRFNDASNPTAGGTIEVLVNGGADPNSVAKMFDNIAVNEKGQVILQEDVGNNPRLGRVWMYDTTSGALVELAQHNPDLFTNPFVPGSNSLPTQDEESSGVIDVSNILGEGTYLLDVQAHYPNANPELVEGGQLLLMKAGPVAGLGFDAAHGNAPALVVLGTSGDDDMQVLQVGSTFNVRVGGNNLASLTGAANQIIAVGYGGDDRIDLSGSQAEAAVYGGDGNDHLFGSAGFNSLNGGNGNDQLDVSASTRVNRLEGGTGNDQFVVADTDIILDFGLGNDNLKKKKK